VSWRTYTWLSICSWSGYTNWQRKSHEPLMAFLFTRFQTRL
jgi:hypothetical protein